jgi:hypothetical protein
MMMPQKNVQSSPNKLLKPICKKKTLLMSDDDATEKCEIFSKQISESQMQKENSVDDDGTEEEVRRKLHSVPSSSSPQFFFLHMCFRHFFGEDSTFFCGIIIIITARFLFCMCFRTFFCVITTLDV